MKRLMSLLAVASLMCATSQAYAGSTVFEDDFSDSGSGWPDTQIADHNAKGMMLYDGSGGYQMTPLDDATYGIVPAPRQAPGPDSAIEANLFLYTGVGKGTGGLVCRQSDQDNFYAFMVSGAHGYAILKVEGGKGETLGTGRFEGMMPNIADVRIGARCQGTTLTLSIDSEVVLEVDDSSHSAGKSGLIVLGERTAGTSAVFDNFVLSTP